MHLSVAVDANQKTRDATKQSLIQAIKRLKNKTPIFAEKDAELNLKNIAIESCIQKSKIGTYMDADVKNILSKAIKYREAEKRLLDTLDFLVSDRSNALKGKRPITQSYVCSLVGIKSLTQFSDEIRDQVVEKIKKAEVMRIKNLLSLALTQVEMKGLELDVADLLKSIGFEKLDDLKGTEFEGDYLHKLLAYKKHEPTLQEQNVPQLERALQRIVEGKPNVVEKSIHIPITRSLVCVEAGYSPNYLKNKKEPYLKLYNKIRVEERIRKGKGLSQFLIEIESQLIQAFDLIATHSIKLTECYSLTMYGVAKVAQNYCGVSKSNQYGRLDRLIAKHLKELEKLKLRFDGVAYYQGLSTNQQWSLLNKAYASYFEKISDLNLTRSRIDFKMIGIEISECKGFLPPSRMNQTFTPLPIPKHYARLLENRIQEDQRRFFIAQCFKTMDLMVAEGETPSLHKIQSLMDYSFSLEALNQSVFYQLLQIKVRRLKLLSDLSLAINPKDTHLRLLDALQRIIEKKPINVSLEDKTSLDELTVLQEAGFDYDSLEIKKIRSGSIYRTILKIIAILSDDIEEVYLLKKYFELKKQKIEQYPVLTHNNWRKRKVYLYELADFVNTGVETLESRQKLLKCFMKVHQDYL